MRDDDGFFTLDLDAIEDAFRAGGHLVIFCNPYNPLGRVFTEQEMTELTDVVDRHGGRVFADEIHGPLVYPGTRHIPYASTSDTAAAHTLTATSASKGWNLPGLKCAQVILTSEPDRQRWEEMGFFAAHGASNPGVVANIAAYRHGEAWLDEVLGYLDESRRLLAGLLAPAPAPGALPPARRHLPRLARLHRDGPAGLAGRARSTARTSRWWTDRPSAMGGAGSFRFNFATPQPILAEMVERIAAVLNSARRPPASAGRPELSRRLARLGQGGGHHVRGLARRRQSLHRLHHPEVGILAGAGRELTLLALHDQDPGQLLAQLRQVLAHPFQARDDLAGVVEPREGTAA